MYPSEGHITSHFSSYPKLVLITNQCVKSVKKQVFKAKLSVPLSPGLVLVLVSLSDVFVDIYL